MVGGRPVGITPSLSLEVRWPVPSERIRGDAEPLRAKQDEPEMAQITGGEASPLSLAEVAVG